MTYYKLNENVKFAAGAETDVEKITKQLRYPYSSVSSLLNKA